MKPQLHTTALNMQCGEAFRRRYIEGEIIPPGVAALVGTATDKSVTKNLQHKIDTHELLPLDEIADTARDGLNEAWDRTGARLEPEEAEAGEEKVKGAATDKAVRLARLHAQKKAPEIEPTQVQRRWSLEIPGYPYDLVGAIDIQERTSIRDTKTSAKTPPDDVAAKSLQLTAYALAVKVLDGVPPDMVALDYLIDNKTPVARTFMGTRSDDDYRALLARIETVTDAVTKGVFIPVSPDHWSCCPKWCGYYATCRYVSHPKQFTIPAQEVNTLWQIAK